jgi:hypothetical protein
MEKKLWKNKEGGGHKLPQGYSLNGLSVIWLIESGSEVRKSQPRTTNLSKPMVEVAIYELI